MRITMQRWIAACVLACAFIAVAMIPSGPDSDDVPSYRWQSQQHGLENRVSQRQRAVAGHARGLAAEYKSAEDAAQAGRVFGPARAISALPDVWFAQDVPEQSRRVSATPAATGAAAARSA